MQKPDAVAQTHNLLGFILVIILALHAVVILGVGFFMQPPKARPAKRIDITLSSFSEQQKVIDADYLAETNQSFSGIRSKKQELTTDRMPVVNSHTNDNEPQLRMLESPLYPLTSVRLPGKQATGHKLLTHRRSTN